MWTWDGIVAVLPSPRTVRDLGLFAIGVWGAIKFILWSAEGAD